MVAWLAETMAGLRVCWWVEMMAGDSVGWMADQMDEKTAASSAAA